MDTKNGINRLSGVDSAQMFETLKLGEAENILFSVAIFVP